MKHELQALLEQQLEFSSGIAYLVPAKWWVDFCQSNSDTQTKEQLIYPPLNLQRYVDTFLLEFQQGIVDELEHKSNYLKINKIFISPQIKKEYEWKLITPQLWKLINNKLKIKFGIITIYNQQESHQVLQQNQIQIQIIFCSKVKSQAFVGFLPEYSNVALTIRNIGFELGFVEMSNSRITFPDKNPEKPYYYCELESTTLAQSQDTLFLAYNLQCSEQKDQKLAKLDFSFGKDDQLGNSNQAVVGDVAVLGVESFQQIRVDGTMSTGAETPSFFGSEEQNRGEFRVRQLFRQKKPEEIQQLRVKAKKIINGDLIKIVEQTDDQLERSLGNIVHQLQQHISAHKKKIYKDKELYYE